MNEFIDAYSDDQIYLETIEKLVNKDRVERLTPDSIRYSSFCRLWAVMMVGSIESMIQDWASEDSAMADIYSYFQNGSNQERIERVKKAFELRGVPVDISKFEDFLAIKYIRNAYVHAKWNENQRNHVVAQGYPDTVMRFTKEHFDRMKDCYYQIMNGLGMINAVTKMLHS